tara:strand:- start:4196 stop:5548 length:1353 start_codon:yes stop_codon:yes gene_type:complete
MARISQKELLEEGFSDKIRGIAKATAAGIKQAAQQGINLDTGQLAKGMYKSYKGEQPIAFLKKALENDKDIEIVKIDKSNIKKQQASGKKGYLSRIVGPKTITLIPFEGVLYNRKDRRYEGPGAGTSPPPDAVNEKTAYMGDSRDKKGKYKPVSEKGSVKKQLKGALTKIGIDDQSAKEFALYLSKNLKPFLARVQETRAGRGYDFTYDPDAVLGVVKQTKANIPKSKGKKKKLIIPEHFSIRDTIKFSKNVLILEQPDDDFSEYTKMGPVKFIENLSDEQMESLLKNIQKIQPGLNVQFKLKASQKYIDRKEREEKGPKSDFESETGMFVAEIFRTKDGLQLGDIFRREDPTDIIRGMQQSKKKEEVKLSPFDKAVQILNTKNNLTAATLAPALNIKDVNIITDITNKDVGAMLSDKDIVKIKGELIKKKIIKEHCSQKNMLLQLTLLS